MADPRVPGSRSSKVSLPCGESVAVSVLDMGLREFTCDCGERHAVVMDVHPPSRFVPEELVAVLRETIEPSSGGEFEMMHLMGIVLEEFPKKIVAKDVSENSNVGYALLWIGDFDARRLHEIVVELIVELMEHAVSHTEDDESARAFEQQMHEFDVEEFVETYRRERDFEHETDRPV